ncbi:hypothetical protein [Bradyrhizobium niftali]|uniref:hypothetical protein n=1 Tax=Bradyrhizobium niftali TaxID=2560055 RepID=UPI0024BFDB73|nr:hypothetical protein [Bradyrhizobium niftali]
MMRDQSEKLAILVTGERGKPLAEVRHEVACGAGLLEWFAAEGGGVHTEGRYPVIRLEISFKCKCRRSVSLRR